MDVRLGQAVPYPNSTWLCCALLRLTREER